jgi:F0F1-type ATP synthase delta subunit
MNSIDKEKIKSFFNKKRKKTVEKVYITSAIALDDSIKGEMEKKYHGENREFIYRVNKSLIGGVIVRIKSDIEDYSIKSKLHILRKQLIDSM